MLCAATLGGTGATGHQFGLQLFVANYRRLLAVSSFSCDQATHQCVPDPRGQYTDEGACNANCRPTADAELAPPPPAVWWNSGADTNAAAKGPGHPWPPEAHRVTIHVKHGGGNSAPAAAVMRRIDSKHANGEKFI